MKTIRYIKTKRTERMPRFNFAGEKFVALRRTIWGRSASGAECIFIKIQKNFGILEEAKYAFQNQRIASKHGIGPKVVL